MRPLLSVMARTLPGFVRQGSVWVSLLLCLFSSVTYAASPNYRIEHCISCGKALVGSAVVQPDTIQWEGSMIPSSLNLAAADPFGFTGQVNYLQQGLAPNTWTWESPALAAMQAPQGNGGAPSLGFFFAPNNAQAYEIPSSYEAYFAGDTVLRRSSLNGQGVADDINNPALTLDVNLTGTTKQDAGNYYASLRNTVTFSVTPRLNTAVADTLGLTRPVTHAYIEAYVFEENTGCTPADRSFDTRNSTPNSFVDGAYYQYMYPGSQTGVPGGCIYKVEMIASIGKEFKILAQARRYTGAGRVRYVFAVRGHYNPQTPTAYPGGYREFSLKVPSMDFSCTHKQGRVYALDGSASIDLNGNRITAGSYSWSSATDPRSVFSAQGQAASDVTFSSDAENSVTLSVPDGKGSTASVSKVCTQKATASFTYSQVSDFDFSLDGSSSHDAKGNPIQNGGYAWSSTPVATISGQGSANANLRFPTYGTYNVRLVVTDTTGASSNASLQTIIVSPKQAITASFSATQRAGNPNVFDLDGGASFAGDNAYIESYRWEVMPLPSAVSIPSGQTSTVDFSQLSAGRLGWHTVKLTVRNNLGATAETYVSMYVSDVRPQADFSADTLSGMAPLEINVDASTSSSPLGKIVSYRWEVLPAAGVTLQQSGFGVPQAKITLSLDGSYKLTLMVTDDKGQVEFAQKSVVVGNIPPTAVIDNIPSPLYAPVTVFFDGSQSRDGDNPSTETGILHYLWSMSSGNTNNLFSKTPGAYYTFTDAGTYGVNLDVVDDEGTTGSKQVTVQTVYPAYPGLEAIKIPAGRMAIEAPGVTTQFKGGALYQKDGSGNFLTSAETLGPDQSVRIVSEVSQIDPAHQGKRVDLVSVLMRPGDVELYTKTAADLLPFYPFPLSQLVNPGLYAQEYGVLLGSQAVRSTIFDGKFSGNAPGKYLLWVGYRLAEPAGGNPAGTLFVGGPITVELR